jgi:hypothetical protein
LISIPSLPQPSKYDINLFCRFFINKNNHPLSSVCFSLSRFSYNIFLFFPNFKPQTHKKSINYASARALEMEEVPLDQRLLPFEFEILMMVVGVGLLFVGLFLEEKLD